MFTIILVLGLALIVAPLVTFLAGGAAAFAFFKRRAPQPELPAPMKRDLAPEVIELAHKSGGRLTAQQISEQLAVPAQQTTQALATLVNRRVCHVESHLGQSSYVFESPKSQVTRSALQELPPGAVIGGRYEILRCLNKGGMGAIYEARDHKLADSLCAVKEILQSALHGDEGDYMQSRFQEEMTALAGLDHPSIPKVRDYISEDGSVLIVMDLVRGVSLEQEVERDGALEPAKAIADILSLLRVVKYLHSQEPPVIHRDIKPANLMRDTASGVLKLVDFGLARRAEAEGNNTSVGTMGYCAPEQISGRADARSDLFSVGCTLAHLLTGVRPQWNWLQPLHADLPTACAGLAPILERATQPFPDDRYQTAQEFQDALETWNQTPAPSTRLLTR